MRARLVLGALVLATASGTISTPGANSRPAEYPGLLTFVGGDTRGIVSPIGGEPVTLEEARSRAPYPLPLLPPVPLPQVCDEGSAVLSMLQAWSGYESTEPEFHQTALTYNHGVYLQVEPIEAFVFGKVDELPPVEEFFDESDYPEGLLTSSVRDHRAWVNELTGPVTCPLPPDPIWYTPGPQCPNGICTVAPPPQTPGAFMFSPFETAVLKWIERGVVVEIVGPYPSEILKALAEGIRWPDR